MHAATIQAICVVDNKTDLLEWIELADPSPSAEEVLIKVRVCGVCHTELDEIEGRLTLPHTPIVPGHQVIGEVISLGAQARRFNMGDRVGVAWIYHACGKCEFCLSGRENLCRDFVATGRDVDGGYAPLLKVPQNFAYSIPAQLADAEAAPLLCAGAIGYRSLRLSNLQNGQNLGLAGFGSSGHLVLKAAKYLYPKSKMFVFVRSELQGDFALELGADWAGNFSSIPPVSMHAIIDTTPSWGAVVKSLEHLERGGRLVINAIRKESRDQQALLDLDYSRHLWLEKEVKTVANVTRDDVQQFLNLAAAIGIRPEVQTYPLEKANDALRDLKRGGMRGAKVLVI